MSAAIRAKTAKERATIAIRQMKTQLTLNRAFSDCFQMGDGDEVIKIIKERAKRDPVLMGHVLRVFALHIIADLG